jgi:hypothetical protein
MQRLYGKHITELMRDINAIENVAGSGGDLTTVFDVTDFAAAIGNFTLLSSAQQLVNSVRLTPQTQNTKGGLWYKNRVRVKEGFRSTFTFRMNELYGIGADGISFIVQNKQAAICNGDGGDLGAYFDNRLAVEFDTFYNSHLSDPTFGGYNHVGAFITPSGVDQRVNHTNALMTQNILSPTFTATLGAAITAIVEYDGTQLTLTFSGGSVPVPQPVTVDIGGTLTLENGAYAYVGINAACGTAASCHQAHWIDTWKFEQASPVEQTEWLAYKRDGTMESLGTPDGGVSVPLLDALDLGQKNAQIEPQHLVDMRDAIETLAEYYGYDWTPSSTGNLYYNAMGDRTAYGASGGARYDWTRSREEMLYTPTYDIDIGEIYECVRVLKVAAGLST